MTMYKMNLLLATGNTHKVEEISAILRQYGGEKIGGIHIVTPRDLPAHEPPEEDGATFAENAYKKGLYYARLGDMITLADDSGLEVAALEGRPGIFSSRYASNNHERIRKILEELYNVPASQRNARFVCAAMLIHPRGDYTLRHGYCHGEIAFEPRGEHGFGFDPVFLIPPGIKTMAELTLDEKNMVSHRAKAVSQLVPLIQKLVDLERHHKDNYIFELFETSA